MLRDYGTPPWKFQWYRVIQVLLSCLCLSNTTCQRSLPPPPPPDQILVNMVERMQSLSSFRFMIDRQGAPAFLDPDQMLSFRRTEGYFIAPDRAWAVVRVIAPGVVAEVQVISIGDNYWETQLLTNEWQALPAGQGFNPVILFDPQTGFPPILREDIAELTLIGRQELEDLPGISYYALQGKLTGGRIYAMSYGLIGPEQIDVQLWVEPETYDLARAVLYESSSTDEGTTWQVDFWDYNQALEINPPLDSTSPVP